ncbi:MAG: ABC transporter substrate-binding protein, partial [Firmicutes bacterium]|nr:ABC transporter substrate-binding protein [Bacillota bacterium]
WKAASGRASALCRQQLTRAARRAAAMAVDREQIATLLFQDRSCQANGPLPPDVLGYDENLRPFPYDPRGARELLSRSGYPNGFKITLITYENTRPYNPAGGEKLAKAVREDFLKAGIDAEIKTYPWLQYKEALLREEGNAFLYGWIGDNGDPDNFLYTLLSSSQIENGLNASRYRNSEVDLLLFKAQQETEPVLREQLYRKAVRAIVQDTPWVFLNHSLALSAVSPGIEGFILNPVGFQPLFNIHKK